MATIATEYRGHIIEFNEHNESWSAQVAEGKHYTRQTLAEVKKKIDDFIKAESDYKELSVITVSSLGYRSLPFGTRLTITSVDRDGDVWVRTEKGERQKIGKGVRNRLCAVTPENEAKVQEYHALEAQSQDLDRKMKDVADSMIRVFKD